MELTSNKNCKAPLLSWDIFCITYNSLMKDAEKHQQSALAIKQIALLNKWSKQQTKEAIENIQQYVIVVTDHLQRISYTGKGFQEMTGYSFEEAKGRNPKFLQGIATNKENTQAVRQQLYQKESTEIILENYRKNGEQYLCKIIIKPIININNKLVNFIAYEKEIAA
ncbi:PAS domain-containing protein [Ferruginibacter sp.]|uniref:PAS domain-containing protein n=1 Tax=Ferruginibacter sp. TaxID=1940288 RepID=UPI0026590295|nr:PAS domain-containing protein [Ferruginibacter sp.]